jgi:hypothetical protein
MLLTNLVLAGLAAAASAIPTRVERQIPNNEVTPWEITYAVAGSYKNTGGSVRIEFTNPNTYKVQRVPRGYAVLPSFDAICNWSWSGDAIPEGVETTCEPQGQDNIYGNLTMTLRQGPNADAAIGQGNFAVDIKETRTVTIFGLEYIRVWEGRALFQSGDSWKLICGNSGQCSWSLPSNKRPYLIKQELTKSVGSCEESTVGGC